MVRLGLNIASLTAQRGLASHETNLSRTFERLASGSRINRASDDAAGLAIASKLSSDRRVYAQGVRNLNDGISALNIAESGLAQLTEIISRQQELATQAANGVLSSAQRAALDKEFQALGQEYGRVIEATTYNGKSLIDGSSSAIELQTGGSALTAKILPTSGNTLTGTGDYKPLAQASLFDLGVSPANGGGYRFLTADLDNSGGTDLIAVGVGGLKGGLALEVRTIIPETGKQKNVSIKVGDDSSADVALLSVSYDKGKIYVYAATMYGDELEGSLEILADGEIGKFVSEKHGHSSEGKTTPIYADFDGDGVADRAEASGGNISIFAQRTAMSAAPRSLSQSTMSIATEADAGSAVTALDTLQSQVSEAQAIVGASISRAQAAASVLSTREEGVIGAAARIRDADVAVEVGQMTRLQILRDTTTAILAQANQQSSLALTLLGITNR